MTSVSSTTTSSLSQYVSSTSSLDTNGDGVVSAEELAAASGRTQDPTVSSDSAATSTTSQAAGDMMAMFLAKGDTSSAETAAKAGRFAAMDTDGDNKVSEKEFVDSRPDDISAEDAAKVFNSLDTENTGSLTQEQLDKQKPHGRPMGGMQGMESLSSILSADGDSDSDTMSMDDVMSQMSSVIAAYRSAGGTTDETSTSSTVAATTEKAKSSLTV